MTGKSGVERITQYDATEYACQIASEVKNFDPLQFIEKKEVKKMGRFIHLAVAAADEAVQMSGLKVTPENSENLGVHIGSGIGGGAPIHSATTARTRGRARTDASHFFPCSLLRRAPRPLR